MAIAMRGIMNQHADRPNRVSLSLPATCVASILALMLGCGGSADPTATGSTGSSTGGGGTAGVGGSSSTTGGGGTGVGGTGGGTVQPDGCYDALASDVSLEDVQLFQVVGVDAAIDGEAIPVDYRNAPLVQGRDAVLRARIDVGSSFAPRELAARVTINTSGGEQTFLDKTMISGDADHADPTSSFVVELPASALVADATYSVSIVECDEPKGAPASEARFPVDGEAELGAIATGPLKIHLVPFEVSGFAPDTSAAVIDGFRDAALAVYPVTSVEVTVAPLVQGFSDHVDTTDLLVETGAMQDQIDLAPADVYYYGIFTGYASRQDYEDQCDCPTGTSQELFHRAGFAVGAAFADQKSEDTLIHEMGHLHGLPHAPCGGAPGDDPGYPYEDGIIHSEGWDIRTSSFVPSSHKDMMAYCYPRWISDYNYEKLASWVQMAQADWVSSAASTSPPGSRPDVVHCTGY